MRPLIVALDVETDTEALRLVRELRFSVDLFKVGPVLFMKYGGALLSQIRSLDAEIFLDMKFHDIPSVVAKAIERAAQWGVYSATIHTSGGFAMMQEAAAVKDRPKLWGVTVLTSMDAQDLKRLHVTGTVQAQARSLAKLAAKAGLDGVISSVREAAAIKKACGKEFEVVTPGIRVVLSEDDQKRVETPQRAIQQGATFFVMGRPVVESPDPRAMVESIYQSLKESQ